MSKQEKQRKPELSDEEKRRRMNEYLKYSGMAFQMGAIILAGVLIGQQLDNYFQTQTPYFTLGMVIFSVFAAFYLTLKDFIFPK